MSELPVSRAELTFILDRIREIEDKADGMIRLRREVDIPEDEGGGVAGQYAGPFGVFQGETKGSVRISSGLVQFVGKRTALTTLTTLALANTEGMIVGEFDEANGLVKYRDDSYGNVGNVSSNMQTGVVERIIALYVMSDGAVTEIIQMQYGPIIVPWLEWFKSSSGIKHQLIAFDSSVPKIGMKPDWVRFGSV
jgi:hypothetical protein